MATTSTAISYTKEASPSLQGPVVVLGRFLIALIFLMSVPHQFSRDVIAHSTSQGVPLASLGGSVFRTNRTGWRIEHSIGISSQNRGLADRALSRPRHADAT